MTGAAGDGQGVDTGVGDKLGRFFRVREHLVMGQLAFGTDAVLFAGLAGFKGAQAANLALHRDPAGVCHFHYRSGHPGVVLVIHGGFAILTQGAIHHHRTEPQLYGALADGGGGPVVLMYADRYVGELLHGGFHHGAQKRGACILPRAGTGLHDDRRVGGIGGLHDGSGLFQIIDVKSWNTVLMLGSVVQKLSQANQCHGVVSCCGGGTVPRRFDSMPGALFQDSDSR